MTRKCELCAALKTRLSAEEQNPKPAKLRRVLVEDRVIALCELHAAKSARKPPRASPNCGNRSKSDAVSARFWNGARPQIDERFQRVRRVAGPLRVDAAVIRTSECGAGERTGDPRRCTNRRARAGCLDALGVANALHDAAQHIAVRGREWLSRSMIAAPAPGWRGATQAHPAGM